MAVILGVCAVASVAKGFSSREQGIGNRE